MTQPATSPSRPLPQQDRSRRTEQALLDAALSLFRDRDADTVTVGEIALAAGVAPATIYRRFGDKEGLLKEVFTRFIAEAMQVLEVLPVRTGQDIVALLADVTHVVMLFSQVNQRLLQSAYAKALVDRFYETQMVALSHHTIATLKRHFIHQVDRIGHPQPSLAIDFMLRQAVAMLSARMAAGKLEAGNEDISDAVFLRELLRSLLGYLQIPHTVKAIDKALSARRL